MQIKPVFLKKEIILNVWEINIKKANISHLINDLQVCKFYVLMDSNDDHTFHNINSIIKKYGDKVHAQVSDFPNVDIMSIKASKGNALEYLFKINNLDFNRTICFGDGENDFSMFKISKYSENHLKVQNILKYMI
ncbi:HAD family hydrolase [Mycoplasmopsis cynos]|nr:HAD family hydrolase [Mycoplasmopsis cynos]UWV81913.1 HAD family hydrolase [Mycoplasmopsis cynos]